jgi:urea transport system ATP-binding protein
MIERARNSILYLDGVSVSFDGFRALNNLSLVIEPGELRAIIGPNGAGKTTMMDVITGKTTADEGTIYFNGTVDLTRLDEADTAQLGIGRKFQKPTVFENRSVRENIELALAAKRGVFATLFHRRTKAEIGRVDEILETIRLTAKRDWLAANLSHGQKQWLEIGMLLAQEPKLLLVDEPAAGMTDSETEATLELLRDIALTRSVVVVEHDMHFVRGLAARVTVLHEGSVLSEGSFEHVSSDPRVIEVYLGR